MVHQSISGPNASRAALELQRPQNNAPQGPSRGLAAQVRPSANNVVPYDFSQGAFNVSEAELRRSLPELTSDVEKLKKMSPGANPLAYAQAHMALEGKILSAMPGMSYKAVQQMLAQSHGIYHPALVGHEELEQLNEDLAHYLSKSDEQAKENGGFKGVIDRHVARMGDALGFCHSLYENALENVPQEQRVAINQSRKGFESYANGFVKEATQELPRLLTNFFDNRIAHVKGIINNSKSSEFNVGAAKEELAKLEIAKNEFSLSGNVDQAQSNVPTLKDSINESDGLKTSLNHISRDSYVASLKADRATLGLTVKNSLLLGAAKGVPQGVASQLHLGETRSATDQHMRDIGASFAGQVAATAAATGLSHKVVSDAVRPFVQLLMDQTIGLSTAKADALKVYPKPLKQIAENGQRVENFAYNAQGAVQKAKQDSYKRSQNANNFGTMSGDMTGWSAFGGSNLVRDLVQQFTEINADNVHVRALASAVGGMFMAGGQEVAKYLQTHGDESIPTHVLKRNTQEFKPALTATYKGAKAAIDPTKRATYNDLAGRVLSLAEGLTLSTTLANHTELTSDASINAKLAHCVSSFFSSWLTLQPFFSNNQALPESKAIGGGKDHPSQRYEVPLNNIMRAGGSTVPKTQDSPVRGTFENMYHISRGVSQAFPQITISGANKGLDWAKDKLSRKPDAAEQADIEMEEGRVRPKSGEGTNRKGD